MIQSFVEETQELPIQVAAALASILNGDRSLMIEEPKRHSESRRTSSGERESRREPFQDRSSERSSARFSDRSQDRSNAKTAPRGSRGTGGRETFRIEVGSSHGVKPANIVGAIANEAGLTSSEIGEIQIMEEYSTVSLPAGMPRDIFRILGRAWVVGRQLRISKLSDHPDFKGNQCERRGSRSRLMRK